MRIIYVLSENLNRTGGGIVHFLAVAGGLKKLGHEVSIMAPQYSRKIRRPKGLRGIFIPLPGRSVLTFLVYQFIAALVFPLVVLLRRPQAILVRGGVGLFWLLHLSARLFGVRVVLEMNGIPWAEMVSRGFSGWQAWITKATTILQCRTAHRVISVTPAIGAELAKVSGIPAERVFPIQNGADPDEFDRSCRDRVRACLELGPETFVVGFLGRFSPWHGAVELVNSVRYLPVEVRSNILYLLVGSGPRWNEARQIVKAERLEDVVKLPGAASRAEVGRYLAAFDVGVLVNTDPYIGRFGFSSLKFWEYLAAGLPVVVQDNCNLTPIVEGRRMGLVIRDTSPEGIAAVVAEAYRRREEMAAIGKHNRQLMFDEFSWLHVARRVAGVLEDGKSLLEDRARPI